MKVRVKKNCTAFYKLRLLSPGEIVDYDGTKPPVWGEPILTEENDLAKFVVKPPKDVNKSDAKDVNKSDVKDVNKSDVKEDEELTKKFNELLDEAVNLGIAYTPDENATAKEKISALEILIQKSAKDNG